MREMKDSGVEWIGEIPKDWEIVPLTKQLDSIVDYRGKTPEKTEEGTFLVTAKNIKDGKICYELSKEYVREADYEEIMHRGIPQIGDVLFTTEAPLGQVANVDRTDIALAQRIIKFRALSTVNNYYLKYWMLNEGFQQFLHSLSTGSTATGLKSSKLFLLPLVSPNIEQQNKIVGYLDAKCSKIDEVIEKQQAIIEKLKEYKLSVIIETVTKGLNPNVEMKDSGVEWIGQMPTSWDCTTVGRIATVVRGASPRPAGDPLYFNGNDVPWITVAEVTKGDGKYIDVTETYLTFEGAKQSRIVEEGTLLLSNSGATLGVPKITRIRGCINDGSVAFYNLSINQEFLLYLFKGRTFELRKQMQGYGQPNLNTTIVKGIEVTLPTELEQKLIVDFLDQKCTAIEKTIEDREKAIEKLQEYKKSLIYEVVTGKKEV